ncbi:hypothetical protein CVD28_05590 [Bacillus sp. M6-12]|uniref:dienelactone hydrolase family protein n=1 Tax=Bacillus sp. M6-12 TaxID=2054166 RepID=UPI000C7684E4|nr:dienelactone hydrolase family protein [Bacillus sp. M6-12]PLS18610.1 hypothetical protein CVD28_05590 [Bacillus sp. M6-12]
MEKTYINQNKEVGGWLVKPEGLLPAPVIILMPAVHGLTPYIKDVLQRLAEHGYVAFALDYYTVSGQPDVSTPDKMQQTLAGLSDEKVMADTRLVMEYLQTLPEVMEENIAVMGFCVGGKFAYLAGCEIDGLNAAIDFYGMVHQKETTNQPVSPIKKAANLKLPLLAHFGEIDPLIPMDHVANLEDELKNHNKIYEIRTYRGAGHAFHDHTRGNYRPAAAKEAWDHTVTFLEFYLKGKR